jgi:hypothetical protein
MTNANPCTVTTFDAMVGRTMTAIDGLEAESESATFRADDGSSFRFHYVPDCCACCRIVDVVGDVDDLLYEPLLVAEEVSSEGAARPEHVDSYTWTFYRFATVRGTVTVRWLGESSGYYSESVTYSQTLAREDDE